MKRLGVSVAVAIVAAFGMHPPASAAPAAAATKPQATTIAVYGDATYGAATVKTGDTITVDSSQYNALPAFLSAINADPDVSLVAHVGDIHAGKQYCTQAYDQGIYAQWTALQDPLVYTPGDNE